MRIGSVFSVVLLAATVSSATAELALETRTASSSPSEASFSGGASSDGVTTKTAFARDSAFSVDLHVSIDPRHQGQAGAFFVLGTVGGALFRRLANGAWTSWDGDFGSLQPTRGPRILGAQESIFVFSSPGGALPGANVQALLAYTSSDNDIQYNWPPVPVAIAGRCESLAGTGSLVIDANNTMVVAEVVYRLINALSDTSSLIDQVSRSVATTAASSTPCTVAGSIHSSFSKGSAPGRLDNGEQVDHAVDSCVLGDSVVMDGDASLTAMSTSGAVNSGFGNDWAYSGSVAFTDFAHIRGSITFLLEGDYSIASHNYAKTGIQTIDFDSEALDVYFNGFPLELTELCHESNAFGASQQQSESFGFHLQAGALGGLVINSVEPFGGPFGGPSTFGRMEISGGAGSGVTVDASQCGPLALEVTGRGSGGVVVTPQPNCISIASFQD